MALEGVDYSYSRPTPAQLVKAGKRFAVRYFGTQGSGKNATHTEIQALQAAGLAVVANYEGRVAGWMSGGHSTGQVAASAALADAAACGMPTGRPIYFSADYNATYDQYKTQIKPCLQGAGSILGVGRVGIYGGIEQVDWAWADGLVRWVWQTYAWSYGQWSRHCHLQQYHNGVTLGSGTVDLDRAITADYGQWATTTQEDLTVIDADTKTYLDSKFAAVLDKIQGGTLILMRGDDNPEGTPDTHPNNLERTRQDIATLAKTIDDLKAGIPVTLSDAQLEILKQAISLEGSALVQLAVTPPVPEVTP